MILGWFLGQVGAHIMMEAGKSLSLMKPSRFEGFIWHDCAYIFLMMDLLMEGSFQAFGVPHNLAMLTTLIVAVVLTAYARSGPDEGNLKVIRYVLGALLLISVALDPVLTLVRYGVEELGREMVVNDSLPFYLCDVVAIVLAFALFTKNQRLVEIGYLWAIAGTLQGLIMPTLWFDHGELEFYIFFLQHGGGPVAAIFLVWGLGIVPLKGAMRRAIYWSLGYMVIVMFINWIIGANYGFLNHKPAGGTLFDHMGPWPHYLVTLQVIAYALYFFLLKIAPRKK